MCTNTYLFKGRNKINLKSYHLWVVRFLVIYYFYFLVSTSNMYYRYNKKVVQTTENLFENPKTQDPRQQGKRFKKRDRWTDKKQENITL